MRKGIIDMIKFKVVVTGSQAEREIEVIVGNKETVKLFSVN